MPCQSNFHIPDIRRPGAICQKEKKASMCTADSHHCRQIWKCIEMLCDAMLVIIPSGGDVGAARHARRWRPSQAQQELMQARQDSLTFENSIMCAYWI